MKKKIGTILDNQLLRRTKEYSANKQIPFNQVIEEALEHYLDTREIQDTRSLDEVLKAKAGSFVEAGKGSGAGDISDEDFD
jgi:hypothetical protein